MQLIVCASLVAVLTTAGCHRATSKATEERDAVTSTASAAAPREAEAPAPPGSGSAAGDAGPLPTASAKGPERFPFDFDDIGLDELVRAVSLITGKRFIATGKMPEIHATIRSPEPVTADEAYKAFLTVLQANGLTIQRRGRMEVIVPSASILNR